MRVQITYQITTPDRVRDRPRALAPLLRRKKLPCLSSPQMRATRLEDPRRLADQRCIAETKLDGPARAAPRPRPSHRPRLLPARPRADPAGRPRVAAGDPLARRVGRAGRRGGGRRRQRGHPGRFRGARSAGEPDSLRRVRSPRAGRPERHGRTMGGPAEAARGSARGASTRCVPRASDRGCAGALGHVGRAGRRRQRAEETSLYRPGVRSPSWLKLKPKLTLEVVVTGGSAERVRWGDWGEAVMLAFHYTYPRTGADIEIRQAVRVPRDLPFDLSERRASRVDLLGRDDEPDAAASGAPASSAFL